MSAQEECLGLAVLDLWRMAQERHQSVRELCKTVRYLSMKKVSFSALINTMKLGKRVFLDYSNSLFGMSHFTFLCSKPAPDEI